MTRETWESLIFWAKLASGGVAWGWAGLAPLVQVLIVLMGADIAVGIMAAFIAKAISSDICWRGVLKKAIVLIIVAVCAVLEPVTGLPVAQAVAGFYAAHELLSLLSNAERAGLPVPQSLRDAMVRLAPQPPAPQPQKAGDKPQ